MTVPVLKLSPRNHAMKTVLLFMLAICVIILFFSSSSLVGSGIRSGNIEGPRRQLVLQVGTKHYDIPSRVRGLLARNEVVGDLLGNVKAGLSTAEEALHGEKKHTDNVNQPPMTLDEIINFLSSFLRQFHGKQLLNKHKTFYGIWEAYHDFAVKTLYPWDKEYLQRMPVRRIDDDSVFLSLASYRDENCVNTIKGAYEKSKNPEKLFVGLVQQNCVKNCRSGVLSDSTMVDVEPDEDCYKIFCQSDIGRVHCEAGQVRVLHIDEDESLGPYAARYFASKLWYGEQWYMQIDSHMFFRQDWDSMSIDMLKKAPSKKPVLSHYPPAEYETFDGQAPSPRLCGSEFANSDLEAEIIRLGGETMDSKFLDVPRFAPYTAAGYFVAHSDMLREVPFDPFLPWIFMGEEIIMSSRLWTHGYDIFAPTTSVVSHIYFRRHKPKFWESVHRVYTYGVHNSLQKLVLLRVKHQLGYPEAARDMVLPKSILTAVEQYSMGSERSLSEYLTSIAGLDMKQKRTIYTGWCENGKPPKGFEQYEDLYK